MLNIKQTALKEQAQAEQNLAMLQQRIAQLEQEPQKPSK